MADSLVLGQIEVLSGGVPCGLPDCPDAIFRLGTGWSLSAPQWTSDKVAGLLMDGEQITAFRASNRQPQIPVTILVPTSGDIQADRSELAAARELLLQTCSAEHWQITWTRDGGLPLVFDCQGVASTVVAYSQPLDWGLVSQVEIQCEAFPFGHSEDQQSILLTAPSSTWDLPLAPVTLDDYQTAENWLAALPGPVVGGSATDNATFETSIGTWVNSGGMGLPVRSAAQFHSGSASMLMTCNTAGNMQAAHVVASNYNTGIMLAVNPGETITVRGWFRAAATGRSCNVGADFYDSNGVFISTLRGSNVTDTTTGWTQATASLTAPAGAAYCRVNIQVLAAALNEQHYFDDPWLDGGGAESYQQSSQWTQSTQNAVIGTRSALWARSWHTAPVYDSPTVAVLDITGRAKFTVYAGLTTTGSQWSTWHGGDVHFSVTLYDATGRSISARARRRCKVSALANAPHWQKVTIPLPQTTGAGTGGFDFTTVSRYVLTAWNKVDPGGTPVLQAGLYLNQAQAVATSTANLLTRGALHELPGIIGTARCPLGLQAQPGPSVIASTAVFTAPGPFSWLVPAGITNVSKAEAWAAGGGGAGSGGPNGNSDNGGGGGGGGEYAQELGMPVTAGLSYSGQVGAAGANGTINNPGNSGGDSYFTAQSGPVLRAHGGQGGATYAGNIRGKGGSGSTNYLHYSGGDGRPTNAQNNSRGGGGGGSAGPYSPGNDGGQQDVYTAASAVTGGGPGGKGGEYQVSLYNTGTAPVSGPGGGGGGGAHASDGHDRGGGNGYAGQVKLTYGASGLIPLVSLLAHMPDPEQPLAWSPVVPVGNGADTPNGATEYRVPDVGSLAARFDGTYTCWLVGSGTWGSAATPRTVTVVIKQYAYSGGPSVTTSLSRTFTPSTDIVNGYIDLGQVTLPIQVIPPGNSTAAYFTLTVTSGQTADRFLDVVFTDTQGVTALINTPGGGWNNIWLDTPDRAAELGMIFGSDADRDRAYSLTGYVDRWPGGPFMLRPDTHNRLLLYAQQGCPAATLTYLPHFLVDRTA